MEDPSIPKGNGCLQMNKSFSFRIHPAGWIILVFAWILAPSQMILAAGLALVWHEAAHLLAMRLCGVKRCKIELTPFGGMADITEYSRLSPGKQMLCASAGVLASLLGMLVFGMCQHPFCRVMMKYHFSLLAVNMLPAWPLDGARVLLAFARKAGVECMWQKVMSVFAQIIGAGFLALGLYGIWLGITNISLLLCGPYLCYAAREGIISEKIRKIGHMAQKLSFMPMLPVRSYVCLNEDVEAVAMRIVTENESGKYHVLFSVDKAKGELTKIYTETELLQKLLKR